METKEAKAKVALTSIYTRIFSVLGDFDGSYIAGPCITDLIAGERENDYELWFESKKAYRKAFDLLYAAKYKNSAEKLEIIEQEEDEVIFKLGDTTIHFVGIKVGPSDVIVPQFWLKMHRIAFYLDKNKLEFFSENSVEFIESQYLENIKESEAKPEALF